MDMSVRTLLLAVALPLLTATAQTTADTAPKKPTVAPSRDVLFRDYALAVCVADGYTAPEVKTDASAVASGYLENGGYPLEAYNDVRELGRKFLTKDYPSIANAKLTLMKCIDFSQSAEVSRVMRKYRKP